MVELSPLVLGITLVILGLAFFSLMPLLLRAVSRLRPRDQDPSPPPTRLAEIPANEDAVLLIEPGGRAAFLNQKARQWFGLGADDLPNLERMARSAHPAEAFLGLCAAEGQARFTIDKSLVEGASYFVPGEGDSPVLVALRRPQLAGLEEGENQLSSHTLSIFSELSQAMSASLDLETTIRTILESVERLVPSDLSEITLLDAEAECLMPYRLVAAPGGSAHLEKTSERLLSDGGFSGHLVERRAHLLIPNVAEFGQAEPAAERQRYPFQSYLGLPLMTGGDLIGTLELASLSSEAFDQNDLEVLYTLCGQAAVALHNALIHREELRRADELAGLAQLSRLGGSLLEPQELYEKLVNSLSSMLQVEILGFLVYDPLRRSLEGQVPFMGMPPQFVKLYRTRIEPGSAAESLWVEGKTIRVEEAAGDPNLEKLELNHLAHAAGIEHAALVPLTSGGRMLGYLHAANKHDGSRFNADDLRFLEIIAGQIAPTIENAALFQDSRRRAQRAEALRRIASLAGSSATLDETLKFSLQELARYLQADVAGALLLDEAQGLLRPHLPSLVGVEPQAAGRLQPLSIDTPQFHETVTGRGEPFASSALQQDGRVLEFYRPLLADFQEIQSLVDVPLMARQRGLGEVLIGSRSADFFDENDLQFLATAAGQIASAVERSSLYAQTDAALQQRLDRLTSVARVGRQLNATLDLERLLRRVYDEMLRATHAHCGSILLFENGASGANPPTVALHLGDETQGDLSSLERRVVEKGAPLIVDEFALSQFSPSHGGIRSALLAPIAYQGKAVGLVHLHARQPDGFDQEALELVQTLSVQAAIALENARRFQQQARQAERLRLRLESLTKLFETAQTLELERPLEESLGVVAQGVRQATPFEAVLIYAYDRQNRTLRGAAGGGLKPEGLQEVWQLVQPYEAVEALLRPEFRMRDAYFIPAESHPEDLRLIPEAAVSRYPTPPEGHRAWQPGDTLMLPLVGAGEEPLGMLCLEAPQDGLRPSEAVVEALEAFADEAALVIESYRKMQALQAQVGEIQDKVGRIEQTRRSAQQDLAVLLHKDLEQTIAIQQLHERARRIRVGLEIAEVANRQPDRSAVLMALGQQMLTQMELDTALVAEPSASGPRLVHSLGGSSEGTNPEALLGQRNPLHHALQSGETLLVPNLEDDGQWQNTPLLKSLGAKGFIALPITSNGRVEAAVLAVSYTPIPAFSREDEQIYKLIANQVSIALQNLHLLTETRRRLREVNLLLEFSRQLGSLDPAQILGTLVSSALRVMSNAHAGVILMWDPERELLVPQAAAGYTDNEMISEITYHLSEALPGRAFESGRTMQVEEVDFADHYNLSPENLLRYRQATGGRVPVSNMVVPIQAGENVLGVMTLDNFNTPAAFTQEDEALVTSLAQQTALTLENARLYHQSEQRAVELSTMLETSRVVTSTLELEEVLALIGEQMVKAIGVDGCTISRWDPQAHAVVTWVKWHKQAARAETTGETYPLAELPVTREVIERRQPKAMLVSDPQADPAEVAMMQQREVKSLLMLPLAVSERLIGVVELDEDQDERRFAPAEVRLAQALADQAAVAIEHARLFDETRRFTEELEQRVAARTAELNREHQRTRTLLRISTELSASLDLDHVINQSLGLLNETTGAEQSTIMLRRVGDDSLVYRAGVGITRRPPTGGRESSIKPGEGLAGWVIEKRQAVLIPDLLQDERWLKGGRSTSVHRSALAVPLTVGEDAFGALLLYQRQPNHFTDDQIDLAQAAANQFAVAINNGELYRLIRDQAEDLGNMLRHQQVEASRSTAMLEGVADGVLVTDGSGAITLFNAAAQGILGMKSEVVVGKSLEEFSGLFGGAAQDWIDTIRQWSQSAAQRQQDALYAERITLDDGRVVSVHLSPVSAGDEFLGTVSIFRDITHQVEVDRLKSEFVATVSHELRTPMTPIKGYVEFLLMGGAGELSEKQTEFLEVIKVNVDRLGILVNDLLDVSRVEAGRVGLSFQPVDLQEVIEEVLGDIRRRSLEDAKPMQVETDLAADLPLVRGDLERLRQILDNLADNAYKYTPENGCIKVQATSLEVEVQVDVVDNGIGIFPEDQERIFERFYRGEDPLVMATAGTGLGLPIVKELVERHDGRIWLESSGVPGEGSTFSFTLPVYRSDMEDPEEEIEA